VTRASTACHVHPDRRRGSAQKDHNAQATHPRRRVRQNVQDADSPGVTDTRKGVSRGFPGVFYKTEKCGKPLKNSLFSRIRG